MSIPFPVTETHLLLPGSTGVLEAIVTPINISATQAKIAIVCHPHPLHGGTMENKVVVMTARALQELGFSTIRFNYRGVGQSEGSFGNFTGETADLLSIMDWVEKSLPNSALCLAGFSFGCYVSAQGALQRSDWVKQLISIAPAVHHADFSVFHYIKCPWLLIQGTKDEVVPAEEVRHFVKSLPLSVHIKLVEVPEATHFFHGKLVELKDIITQEITFR